MRTDLPTQGQIIEELVDRVASFIDLNKPVAFDNALAELIRYHRFVLGLGATTSPDGAPFNYAELAGGAWRAPHAEWLTQYRRLFLKGAERIPENDHFLVALAYALGSLLTLPDDLVVSEALTDEVLNLFPSLIFAVESWVTRRAIGEFQPGVPNAHRKMLAGSDAKAQAAALRRLVGAWESVTAYSPAVAALDRRMNKSREEIWSNCRQAWKFCWRHLVNTGFCVAIAAWNDDEEGAAVFREALVRWPENIRHQLPNPTFLELPEALFPDILNLDWEAARDKAASLSYQHSPSAEPAELFAALLERVHEDVSQLLASLLAYWSVAKKKMAALSTRIAAELLRGEGDEDYGQSREPVSTNRLLLEFLRLQIAGERYQDGTYGAKLDGLISRFDSMTERDVVTGRGYRPSTLHDREGTIWADTAILAAFVDRADPAALSQRLSEIVEAEDRLPQGDRSLRAMLSEFDRYLGAVETNAPQILETIGALGGEAPEHQLHLLGELLKTARKTISDYRARRLRERPVDQEKLEERRAAVEQALFHAAKLEFFEPAPIERGTDPELGTLHTSRWETPKSRLVNPSMGAEVSNEVEAIASRIADRAHVQAVWEIYDLPNIPGKIDATPLEKAFWDAIQPLAKEVGASPRLLIPQRFHKDLIHIIFRPQESPLAGLSIAKEGSGRAYACTIEGISVHIGSNDADTAWLLSGAKLKRTIYSPVADDLVVTIAYVPGGDDPEINGVLEYQYRQSFEWDDSPIFRIALPAAPLEVPEKQQDAKPAEPAPVEARPKRPRRRAAKF